MCWIIKWGKKATKTTKKFLNHTWVFVNKDIFLALWSAPRMWIWRKPHIMYVRGQKSHRSRRKLLSRFSQLGLSNNSFYLCFRTSPESFSLFHLSKSTGSCILMHALNRCIRFISLVWSWVSINWEVLGRKRESCTENQLPITQCQGCHPAVNIWLQKHALLCPRWTGGDPFLLGLTWDILSVGAGLWGSWSALYQAKDLPSTISIHLYKFYQVLNLVLNQVP